MTLKSLYIKPLIIFSLLVLLSSCYKEYSITPEYKSNTFNIILNPDQEDKLYESKGIKYDIEPTPFLYYGGVNLSLNNLNIRGQSSLNVRRKSFSVNINGEFSLFDTVSNSWQSFEKFKLISMAYDYTYIENGLSHNLLSKLGLWDLHTFFCLLELNNNPQGLYLFIEDPTEHAFRAKKSPFILRRHYNHTLDGYSVNPLYTSSSSGYYIDKFNNLYKLIVNYSGKQLYDSLSYHLNIENYMRKMAFDYLVANSDYTDELFFYIDKTVQGNEVFDLIPWDYDDIFITQAHEVGRDWAVGTSFGHRNYNSQTDVLQELNGRLIFSIEDDIDYKIAKDDYLYKMYLGNLEWVLSKINENSINDAFNLINQTLTPFYQIPEVIEQSKYDANPTNYELFVSNQQQKKAFLINRFQFMKDELERQKIQFGL